MLKTVHIMILNFKRILKLTLNLQHKMETRKALELVSKNMGESRNQNRNRNFY